jgi:hypothetical protein
MTLRRSDRLPVWAYVVGSPVLVAGFVYGLVQRKKAVLLCLTLPALVCAGWIWATWPTPSLPVSKPNIELSATDPTTGTPHGDLVWATNSSILTNKTLDTSNVLTSNVLTLDKLSGTLPVSRTGTGGILDDKTGGRLSSYMTSNMVTFDPGCHAGTVLTVTASGALSCGAVSSPSP